MNKKPQENGINPVNAAGTNNDVYFSNEDFSKINDDEKLNEINKNIKSRGKGTAKAKPRKQGGVTSTYVFFIVVIVISMIISIYAIFCLNDVLGITKTKSTVTINISEQIDSTSDAIDLLSDKGLVKCKTFCKLFAKYREHWIGGPYEAGSYYLYGKMGLEGMLITLQGQPDTTETVTITFPEGYTTPEIINKLVDNDVCDRSALLSVIQSTEFSYSLVSDLKADENVPYRLEGYLFPDTYEFYVGESASSAVKKFLENGDSKITSKYRDQVKETGYSMYQIMTIASIVQKEAGSTDQMKTIAAIIENRLTDTTNFPSLGCQSTSDYITNKVAPAISSTSAHTSEYYLSYYNTNTNSTVVGLPAGPICNPGMDAIEAAIYPADDDDYFFFHDTKGNLYTAKTYAEFKTKVQTYAPYLTY